MLPKPTNKYSINSVIKYYEHMFPSDYFHLTSVWENSILTILKATQVSKAAGIDNLSGRFLKDGAKFLSKPISDLCNLSIISEKFPDPCKVAKLKPLYKKGFVSDPCNYRPISLLPLISKVKNKILKGVDRGMMSGMILIDLQKAFDTIDHDVLLQKLYAIGFSKRTVNWFKSYLSNRFFKVTLGNNFSQSASVSCGVPKVLFWVHFCF